MDSESRVLDAEAADDVTGDQALTSLQGRLEQFLRDQPDVADLDEVGGGIYGFRLAGTPNGVSLMVNLTP